MKATLVRAIAGTTLLAGAIAAATAAAPVTRSNPLRVSMFATGNGGVEVILTNTSNKIARVPKYQLPLGELEAKLFSISRDGEAVAYEGPMIKRGLPLASDFAILRPGQSYRSVVQLADAYDMRKSGTYTITLASPMQYASMSDGSMLKSPRGLPLTLQSAPLRMYATGKLPDPTKGKGKPGGGTTSGGVSFVGCDATQTSELLTAVASARSYTDNARGYLAAKTNGPRYTTWFGGYVDSRYSTVSQHFVSIDSAMDQNAGQIKINCGCNQSYYAYVYPTKPYEIFVCRAFWSAPNTGTDSRAGTLVHEMSHFNVVASTDDHVYGQSGAQNLAISDPDLAIDNADSHEYFAENTPNRN